MKQEYENSDRRNDFHDNTLPNNVGSIDEDSSDKTAIAFNPSETIEFKLNNAAGVVVSNVVFEDENPPQMQSQSESTFKFTIEDLDSKKLKVSITLPYGRVKGSLGTWTKKLDFDATTETEYTIAFESPEVGNFF